MTRSSPQHALEKLQAAHRNEEEGATWGFKGKAGKIGVKFGGRSSRSIIYWGLTRLQLIQLELAPVVKLAVHDKVKMKFCGLLFEDMRLGSLGKG